MEKSFGKRSGITLYRSLLLLYQPACIWLNWISGPSSNLTGLAAAYPLWVRSFCLLTLLLFFLLSQNRLSRRILLASCLIEGIGILLPYQQQGWRDEHVLFCLAGWLLYLYGWIRLRACTEREGILFFAFLALMLAGFSGAITLACELVFCDGVLLWLALKSDE